MRVIIAGGTGLIGQALVDSLHHDGHEVIVLGRNPNKTSGLPSGVKITVWDGQTADGWGHLVDGAGAIVNLAGASIAGEGFLPERWTDEKRRAIKDSRVNAGAAITAAVASAKTKPGVLIQSSSVGYYGVMIDQMLNESHAIAHPLMLHIPTADHLVGSEAQAKMHEGLDSHPKVTLHDYAGLDHGFAATSGNRRDNAGAQLADGRTKAFFAEHLA